MRSAWEWTGAGQRAMLSPDTGKGMAMNASSFRSEALALLGELGVGESAASGGALAVASPIDGGTIGELVPHTAADLAPVLALAECAFRQWQRVPAPDRGELVRRFAESLRAHKEALGRLVTLEAGKILEEGQGEVQEMIDICDFAVGLSRQLYGRVIASERPRHRMIESWQPLGVCAILTAFNFPVAVWSWNAAIALVCGEKETGGGREAGSDAWKAYMRRVTTTVNYSRDLPLAQGIRFDSATA